MWEKIISKTPSTGRKISGLLKLHSVLNFGLSPEKKNFWYLWFLCGLMGTASCCFLLYEKTNIYVKRVETVGRVVDVDPYGRRRVVVYEFIMNGRNIQAKHEYSFPEKWLVKIPSVGNVQAIYYAKDDPTNSIPAEILWIELIKLLLLLCVSITFYTEGISNLKRLKKQQHE